MSNPILPTVGRVVHYCPPGLDGQPRDVMAAVVAAVHNDEQVTLAVFDQNGGTFPAQYVPHESMVVGGMLDDDGARVGAVGTAGELGMPFWRWMPYQIGQAAKTEQTAADLVQAEVARQLDAALERLQHNVATPGGES